MLIAEELLLVGTGADGRNLLGSSRNLALAGACLTELALRERVAVDDRKRLQVTDPGSTGEPLLDDALVRFTERAGRKPKDVLEGIGKRLVQPTFEALARRELVRPEPVTVLGVEMSTRWPAVATGPREAVLSDLARVLTGEQEADSRTGALISLLHAVGVLHRVVPKDLRPGLSNRDLKQRAKEVLKGRWAPEAVAKAVEEAMAAMIAVTTAASAASSS